MISETRTDCSFPTRNFLINDFSAPLDRDGNEGGIVLYVIEHIPTSIPVTTSGPTMDLYVEISLKNTKWLLNCSCNLKNIIKQHLAAQGEYLVLCSLNYEKILILQDFTVSVNANVTVKCLCDN